MAARSARRSFWATAAAWFAVGALMGTGILALLTIGAPMVALATIVAVVLAVRGALAGVGGAVAGVSVPAFLVAWLNREGPGDVCHQSAGSGSCTEQWSPWPFLIVAVCLLAVGIWLVIRAIPEVEQRGGDEALVLDGR